MDTRTLCAQNNKKGGKELNKNYSYVLISTWIFSSSTKKHGMCPLFRITLKDYIAFKKGSSFFFRHSSINNIIRWRQASIKVEKVHERIFIVFSSSSSLIKKFLGCTAP